MNATESIFVYHYDKRISKYKDFDFKYQDDLTEIKKVLQKEANDNFIIFSIYEDRMTSNYRFYTSSKNYIYPDVSCLDKKQLSSLAAEKMRNGNYYYMIVHRGRLIGYEAMYCELLEKINMAEINEYMIFDYKGREVRILQNREDKFKFLEEIANKYGWVVSFSPGFPCLFNCDKIKKACLEYPEISAINMRDFNNKFSISLREKTPTKSYYENGTFVGLCIYEYDYDLKHETFIIPNI